MDRLSEIIEQRAIPGIMIFDHYGNLQFANQEALELQAVLHSEHDTSSSTAEAICNLCRKQRSNNGSSDRGDDNRPEHLVFSTTPDTIYSIRRFLIDGNIGKKSESKILILIEKIVEKRHIDFEQLRKEYLLTKCETEIVRLICEGLTNSEIGQKKFISLHTVKTHIKNIMKKMHVSSRGEICAQLK